MSILIKIILLAADSYPPILYENSISVHITDHLLGVSEQLALIHSKCFVDVVLFAAETGCLTIEKLEAMTAVCSVGIDMVIIPGDTTPAVISALIADEAAIGMVNSKTTAVRVIPAIGRKAGEVLDFGGLLGYGPIMAVNQHDPSVFINRGGRLPAPMQSLKN